MKRLHSLRLRLRPFLVREGNPFDVVRGPELAFPKGLEDSPYKKVMRLDNGRLLSEVIYMLNPVGFLLPVSPGYGYLEALGILQTGKDIGASHGRGEESGIFAAIRNLDCLEGRLTGEDFNPPDKSAGASPLLKVHTDSLGSYFFRRAI